MVLRKENNGRGYVEAPTGTRIFSDPIKLFMALYYKPGGKDE
jgi:hypothetical protein